MNIPADINLNYINNLRIVQEYDRAPDGSRLKTLDDMVLEAGFFSNGNQLYARRVDKYANHDFKEPADKEVFSLMARRRLLAALRRGARNGGTGRGCLPHRAPRSRSAR